MAFTSFKEAKAELAKSIKKNKKGNNIRSWSRTDFNALLGAFINDLAYMMHTVRIVDGKLTEVSTPVVKEFREKFIVPILIKYGVDKDEAAKAAADYEFKSSQVGTAYEFIGEFLYQYLDAGKKFTFPSRKDFQGSIFLQENDAAKVERDIRDIKDHRTVIGHKKEKRDKHKTLVKKSTCPAWLRHVL